MEQQNKQNQKQPLPKYKIALFKLIIVIVIISIIEIISGSLFKIYKDYGTLRDIFRGNTDANIVHHQNTIGQAYLLYTPAPNYMRNGVLQHNSAGYRGDLVPLKRKPGSLRILFLGGSTTYGWRVEHPGQTFPAQAERLLKENLKGRFTDIEVLNGGLMWGSTAEILTHYHFKYQYYNPDIVVINTGGNDSEASELKGYYHPDYSHYRQQLPSVRPLPKNTRWVLGSKFISFFAIHIFFKDMIMHRRFCETSRPPAFWYTGLQNGNTIPEEHLAFKRNLETIVREIKANGSDILVLPFQMKPGNRIYKQPFKDELANNQAILKKLAETEELAYAPFPVEVITHKNWSDACHLNAEGCFEKARHVVEYLLPVIDKRFPVE